MTLQERESVRTRLAQRYAGVWTSGDLDRHIDEYVGTDLSDAQVDHLLDEVPEARTVLDIGSGFGAFVLSARARGLSAFGVEIAEFESLFSARRLRRLELSSAIARGDAHDLPFISESFDAITLWNVLEHVPDIDTVLREVERVLRPAGVALIVCPNYLAVRDEAHYHVPWIPLMPHRLALWYLRVVGKDPTFFSRDIHYRTNWGVLRALRRAGLNPYDARHSKLQRPERIRSTRTRRLVARASGTPLEGLLRALLWISFRNPLRRSVTVSASKADVHMIHTSADATRL